MDFNPVPALLGGLTLAVSTSSLMAIQGRVLGISGIAHSVVSDRLTPSFASKATSESPSKGGEGEKKRASRLDWKASTFTGLIVGGALLARYQGIVSGFVGGPIFSSVETMASVPLYRSILAGFLVGLGTKLGSGCTSGHMLCGTTRWSIRSWVATMTFFPTAVVVAQLFPSPFVAPALATTATFSLPLFLALASPALIYTIAPHVLPRSSPLTVHLTSFFIGLHFSIGLALTQMSNPSTVLGFFYFPFPGLPLAGLRDWDPALAMVILGGLLPNFLAWGWIKGWKRPILSDVWSVPTRKDIDWRLIGGSLLFGIGWGAMGICPGPALVVLGSGTASKILVPFCSAFVAGGIAGNLVA